MGGNMGNLLIHSDNLKGLQYLLDKGYKSSIDLCYIDPPYNTGRTFRIDKETGKTRTISNTNNDLIAYDDKFSFDEYLDFIKERIILIHQLLSDKGSLYLHCDYNYSHYLKIICDDVFGRENFRKDITRIKSNPKNSLYRNYGSVKDCILYYTKTEDYIWNKPLIPYTKEEIKQKFTKHDKNGYYNTCSLTAPGEVQNGATGTPYWNGVKLPKGRHWCRPPTELDKLNEEGLIEWSSSGNPRRKIYAHKSNGKHLQDVWYTFKDKPRPSYPTQKNKELLNRIIRTSSNEGSIVLDCFMGSGTTLKEAYKLNREWIGIDSSDYAIELFEKEYNGLPQTLTNTKKYEKIIL